MPNPRSGAGEPLVRRLVVDVHRVEEVSRAGELPASDYDYGDDWEEPV